MINFKDYLTKDILPFWLNNAIDEENGGIFTQLERNGTVYGTEKSVWFQGRALWVFSKAYNYIEKNDAYLYAAKKIYEFLPQCTDTDGRMFFTVAKEGAPIQKRRYYFSETFAAIGCAQYFKATGDMSAWDNAKKYYFTAKNCYDNPSLNPPKLHIKAKAHSPVMIMIATSRSMAECAPTVEEKAQFCAYARKFTEEFLNGGFISEEVNAVLETVGVDGSFINTPLGRTVNPGHGLETAWFLIVEGLLENNEKALYAGKKIIDITMPIGLDTNNGGIISFTDALGKPPTALEWNMKLWWPQNEAIIANRMAYEIFKEEKYKLNYESILTYAFKSFADPEHGEWFGYLNYDSSVSTTLKGNIFKGPFHLPRMLMILSMFENGDFLRFFK
ncbi:MAG: AGE family epimerase/isomerase [Clostridia bacterium]|nr:AGE family epimerase/isomerase [Clostridia bacterium]